MSGKITRYHGAGAQTSLVDVNGYLVKNDAGGIEMQASKPVEKPFIRLTDKIPEHWVSKLTNAETQS